MFYIPNTHLICRNSIQYNTEVYYYIRPRERISLGRRVRGFGISILILNTIENSVTIYCSIFVVSPQSRCGAQSTLYCVLLDRRTRRILIYNHTHNLPAGLNYYNIMGSRASTRTLKKRSKIDIIIFFRRLRFLFTYTTIIIISLSFRTAHLHLGRVYLLHAQYSSVAYKLIIILSIIF